MSEEPRLGQYNDTPIFTIKTVARDTGIHPATLRAWERRYGVLSPGRSDGGYRLYSERDLALLRWLKQQVDAGVSISRAVTLLELRRQPGAGNTDPQRAIRGVPEIARGPDAIADDLLAALLAFDEHLAESMLGEAFALYPIDRVTEEIITPVLTEIGERWHRGRATVIQEHFATGILRRRLIAMFQAYEPPSAAPLAVTGAAPSEWHDVGILLVSLALRRRGWRVIYLGQNVPAEQLLQEVSRLRPDLVCLSASTLEGALALAPVHDAIHQLPAPRPRFSFGGRAFNLHSELRNRFPDAHIAASASALIADLADHSQPTPV